MICFAWFAAIFVIMSFGSMLSDSVEDDKCSASSLANATNNATRFLKDAAEEEEESDGSVGFVLGILFFATMMISGAGIISPMREAKRKADPDKVGSNLFSFLGHVTKDKACMLYYASILIQEFQQSVNGSMYVGERASRLNTRRGNHTACSNCTLCDKHLGLRSALFV